MLKAIKHELFNVVTNQNFTLAERNRRGNAAIKAIVAAQSIIDELERSMAGINAAPSPESPLDVMDNRGNTLLTYAGMNGYIDLVRSMLEAQASPEKTNSFGSTPLHCAAFEGRANVVLLLLEANALPNTPNKIIGATGLFFATVNGHTDLVQMFILNIKADLGVSDKKGRTAIDVAAEYPNTHSIPIIKLLLNHGAPIGHPERLSRFLYSSDQRDPDIFIALNSMCAQLEFNRKNETLQINTEIYLYQLSQLNLIQRKFLLQTIKEIHHFIPSVILELIVDYDVPLEAPRVGFFKPKNINKVLRKKQMEIKYDPPINEHQKEMKVTATCACSLM